MPFKLSNTNSNLALTLEYLNPALANSARVLQSSKKKSKTMVMRKVGVNKVH